MRMNTSLIRRIAFSALLLCLPSGAMPQTIASNTAYHVVRSPSGVFSLVREAAASPRYLASSGAIKTKNLRPAIAQPMFSGSVFSPAVNFASGGSLPLGVAAAVLRTQLANAPADVVLADCGSNAVAVLLGNGDGTLQAPVTYSSGGSCPQAVVIADVNADGIPDLVLSNQGAAPTAMGASRSCSAMAMARFSQRGCWIPVAQAATRICQVD